jgi:hypothetical protein
MYTFLHDLLSDKKGGEVFVLFSGWHFFYIALTLVTVVAVFFAVEIVVHLVLRGIQRIKRLEK